MVRRLVQMLLVSLALATPLLAQNTAQPLRMWYRGAFDGWVDVKSKPDYGYYYHPSGDQAYPLNEAAYGQPIYCYKCGHAHYPGQDICPYCHQACPAGGNDENPNTVYSPRRLPGQYYFEKQPHYLFRSAVPQHGNWLKYTRPRSVSSD